MKRRLFIAADLDHVTRAACARVAERLRAKGWSGRWIAPENYHLTVAFLGDVDDERVPGVVAPVREVSPRIPSFDIAFDTAGAFPNARKPRVAWVGPGAPVPAFGTLCGVVRRALTANGFTFDTNAHPHVTVARADRSTTAALPSVEVPRMAPLHVASLTLYESFTERSGARYEALERFSLRR